MSQQKNMAKRFATLESTSSLLYLSNLNSSGDDVSYLHPKIQTLTRLMRIFIAAPPWPNSCYRPYSLRQLEVADRQCLGVLWVQP